MGKRVKFSGNENASCISSCRNREITLFVFFYPDLLFVAPHCANYQDPLKL